jgi:hypothetical protein
MPRQSRINKKAIILAYLEEHPCVQCGFPDPRALDFHHRNASEKEFGVSRLLNMDVKMDRVWAEVEKCDVLCANCHRIHHAEERGWYIDQGRLYELARRRLAAKDSGVVY